jgi:hypothetical protein
MATETKIQRFDFLATRPEDPDRDVVRQLKLAQNVLSSYSHAKDYLAEALQNSADAIDARHDAEPGAPARILIEFDVKARMFSVADTGTGIPVNALRIVLTPNVTLKDGTLAQTRRKRSRGEKGVGLSFLALASNRLRIETCDGEERYELEVVGAQRWVASDGKTKKPLAELRGPFEKDKHLGSDKYTVVTLSELERDQFSEDLFELSRDELEWMLRTSTAVGNTAALFGEPPTPDVTVELGYTDVNGKRVARRPVSYRYWSPEEFVAPKDVLDAGSLLQLGPEQIRERVRGKAVRYVERWETAAGHQVDTYIFAIDGREMAKIAERRRERSEFFPDEWQGFFVASCDMPAGFAFEPGKIQPRTYLRRMFALLQDDQLRLDLGRKTLTGRTLRMMRDVVWSAWDEDGLRGVVRNLQAEGPQEPTPAEKAAFVQTVDRLKRAPDLGLDVPYLKEPEKRTGVIAVFHELLARRGSPIPAFQTLRTGVFANEDALAYLGTPNGDLPLHMLFGVTAGEIVDQLEQEDLSSATAGLAVIWRIDDDELSRRGVEVTTCTSSEIGATHELLLRVGARTSIPLIVLSALRKVVE